MVEIDYSYKARTKTSYKLAKILVGIIFLNLINLLVCGFFRFPKMCAYFDLFMVILNIIAGVLLALIVYYLMVKKEISKEWK
jgi:hypothetical protein